MALVVYHDNNSTTPIDLRVLEEMLPILKDNFAIPSNPRHFGKSINEKVKQAREQIDDFINPKSNKLIFTSGATEAIKIAIKGIAESYSNNGKHIITVSTEHKAVLDTCKDLDRNGFEVTYLPVHSNGLIDLAELGKTIRLNTFLVSVMDVNNETRVNQPIKEITASAHKKAALLMTDTTKAVGKIDIDVYDLAITLLCFSGHKMYAPKGAVSLYIRQKGNKVKLTPQIHGGGHEQGLRIGKLNVLKIIALTKACEIASEEMAQNKKMIAELRVMLEQELLQLPNTSLNCDSENRIYNPRNICFKGLDAIILIGRMKEIEVSAGSACSSAVVEPSHVLKAIGLNDEDSFASLRFSLGKFNTVEDIETLIQKIKELIQPNFKYA